MQVIFKINNNKMNEKWWRVPSKQIQELKKPCRRLILFVDDFRTSRPNPQREKEKEKREKESSEGKKKSNATTTSTTWSSKSPKNCEEREREKERERTDCHEESELVPLLYIYAPNAKPL